MAGALVVLGVAVESNDWLMFLHRAMGLLFGSWFSGGPVVRRTLLRLGLLRIIGHFYYVLSITTDCRGIEVDSTSRCVFECVSAYTCVYTCIWRPGATWSVSLGCSSFFLYFWL